MPIACPNCERSIQSDGRQSGGCPNCEHAFAHTIANDGNSEFHLQDPTIAMRVSSTVTPRSAPMINSHVSGFSATNPDPLYTDEPLEAAPTAPLPPRMEVHGYRVVRELGRGGMGTVFLAQQLSLGRHVALKIMSKRWSGDATFVARFTREAFAAAQLCHPNIVQIHDIGVVDGRRFFCMEYVPGRSLADVVRKRGRLDPEQAVGYILQAARGLKHAHDRDMIHRDVKPDNLLLDDHGLVKVADLGLVKTAALSRDCDAPTDGDSGAHHLAANVTGVQIALGTPAYMSPEQCRDATMVDRRADIYSLGCTLYVLVTGRPPFQADTAVELMTKQAYEPVVPPDRIVPRVPADLSGIIVRMMAKDPEDRFSNMDEVIRTLEAWLGIRTAGSFCPREDDIRQLESCVRSFNTAPKTILRGGLIRGFTFLVLLTSLLFLFFGRAGWSLGVVGLFAQTALAYFIIDGATRKGPLFIHIKQFLWGLEWWDWGLGIAGIGLFALLLAMSGLFWMWAGFGVIGLGFALALHVGVDRAAIAERKVPLDACRRLLYRLRAQGLDEQDLRQFVAKFSGRNWEPFFEGMFGYEAKLDAREQLLRAGSAGVRNRHADWREPILHALSGIEATRKHERERRLLAAVERAKLIAEGAAKDVAERQANATAEALLYTADRFQREESTRSRPKSSVMMIMSGASDPDFSLEPLDPEPGPDRLGRILAGFVGPVVRGALAAMLLLACGLWAHQNGLLPGLSAPEGASPLRSALELPGIPPRFTNWVDSFNVGIAGLLLMSSLCFRGGSMSVLVLVGAGVAVAGHHMGIRTVEPVSDYHFGLLLGTILAFVGFRLGSR